jgi:hypothetical protein
VHNPKVLHALVLSAQIVYLEVGYPICIILVLLY